MSHTGCLCNQIAGGDIELHPICFGQVWLFEGLKPEDWESLSTQLIRRQWNPGEIMFRHGDPADSMFIIKMGMIKLWKVTEDGRELILDIRKGGDIIGENALIEEGQNYPVNAECLEQTLTCGINRETFESLVNKNPSIGLAVIKNLSRRIDYLTGKLGALSEPSLEEKLYKALASVARQVGAPQHDGISINFPLTHEEIGFLVGAHRVSVTRALGKLKKDGKIVMTERRLFFPGLTAT